MSLGQRLSAAWQALCGQAPQQEQGPPPDEAVLSLQSQVGGLNLDLQKAQDELARQRQRLAAQEEQQAALVTDTVAGRLEDIFTSLAGPLSQLRTQQALLEGGKEIAGRDVMALAKNFAQTLESAGLQAIGQTGGQMAFDSETAKPLSAKSQIEPGEMVTVKFIGYRFNNKVVRKAMVERS